MILDIDIIIYAIIAVVLILRLWSLFGTRSDDEPQRPNPFADSPERSDDMPFQESGEAAIPHALPHYTVAPTSLAGTLAEIAAHDPAFEEKKFLEGARAAFKVIVEDFARQDLSSISPFIGPEVLKLFQGAIEQRRRDRQTLSCKVAKFVESEVVAAKFVDPVAILTVRFVTLQEIILRDSSNTVVGGSDTQTQEVTDTWVFSRDVTSADPNWILVETKG